MIAEDRFLSVEEWFTKYEHELPYSIRERFKELTFDKSDELDDLEQQLQMREDEVSVLEQDVDNLNDEINNLEHEAIELRDKLEDASEFESLYNQAQKDIIRLEQTIQELEERL